MTTHRDDPRLGWRPFTGRDEAWRVALDNAGLAYLVVKRFAPRLPILVEEGDLLSYAWEGLLGAVEAYDPSTGYRFSTFAVACVNNACLRGLRRMQVGRRTYAGVTYAVPSADPLATLSENSDGETYAATAVDWTEDHADDVLRRLLAEQVIDEAFAILPPRDVELLRRIYFSEDTLPEIAADHGVTRQAIGNRHAAILQRLRRHLDARLELDPAAGDVDSPAGPGPDGGDADTSSSAASGAGATHSIKSTDRKETP